ncbi:RtcB family protein [Candidatus Gottesmanbacteria bacterium]|nr:RtcB family protein [Candidatus Gottesmanbacteria bacterium]
MTLEHQVDMVFAPDSVLAPVRTEWVVEKNWNGTAVVDLSGQPEHYVRYQLLRPFLPAADRVVIFPDVSPTAEGIVPTGVAMQINANRHPDYLHYVAGADIGCGMLFGRFAEPIDEGYFRNHPEMLDELYARLQQKAKEQTAALGGGNHFLDIVADHNGSVIGYMVHTGSYGDRQVVLGTKIDNEEVYWRLYNETVKSGVGNRAQIAACVQQVYGQADAQEDTIHNTVDLNWATGKVVIYKGVVHVPNGRTHGQAGKQPNILIPSSMTGDMLHFAPGPAVDAKLLYGVSHGTGRKTARGAIHKVVLGAVSPAEFKVGTGLGTFSLMTPTGLGLPQSELPENYHPLERTFDILAEHGVLADDSISFLTPIAYIGHMSGKKR